MDASGDRRQKSGTEFVPGMKRTSTATTTTSAAGTSVRSPSKSATGEEKKSGKKKESVIASSSIADLSSSPPPHVTRITRSFSSPGSADKRLISFVETVTDRVIDKLGRMGLSHDSPHHTDDNNEQMDTTGGDGQIPLIDLKDNMVVMLTLTAKRPVPGTKVQAFRGTVHLNTNDIRLSEDVDRLLDAARKPPSAKKSPASRSRTGTRDSTASSHGFGEVNLSDGDETASSDDGKSALEKEAKSKGRHRVTGSSLQSLTEHDGKENVGGGDMDSGADQGLESGAKGLRRPGMQRDSRGRKIGSTLSSKKLVSLETRLMERVDKLRHVIQDNGYDWSSSQTMDQTEMARVAQGIDLVAFQKVVIHCRSKTRDDLSYAAQKGMSLEDEFLPTSSPLTPF